MNKQRWMVQVREIDTGTTRGAWVIMLYVNREIVLISGEYARRDSAAFKARQLRRAMERLTNTTENGYGSTDFDHRLRGVFSAVEQLRESTDLAKPTAKVRRRKDAGDRRRLTLGGYGIETSSGYSGGAGNPG